MWTYIRDTLTKNSGVTVLGFLAVAVVITVVLLVVPLPALAVTALTFIAGAAAGAGFFSAGSYSRADVVSKAELASVAQQKEKDDLRVQAGHGIPTNIDQDVFLHLRVGAIEAQQITTETRLDQLSGVLDMHVSLDSIDKTNLRQDLTNVIRTSDANADALRRHGVFASVDSGSAEAANDATLPARGVRRRTNPNA